MMQNHYESINARLEQLGDEQHRISSKSSQNEVSDAIIALFSLSGGRIPEELREAAQTLAVPESRIGYDLELISADAKREREAAIAAGEVTAEEASRYAAVENMAQDDKAMDALMNVRKEYYALRRGIPDKYHFRAAKVTEYDVQIDAYTMANMFRFSDHDLFQKTFREKTEEFTERKKSLTTFLESGKAAQSNRHHESDVLMFDALYEAGGSDLVKQAAQARKEGNKLDNFREQIVAGKTKVLSAQMAHGSQKFQALPKLDQIVETTLAETNRYLTGGFRESQVVWALTEKSMRRIVEKVRSVFSEKGEDAAMEFLAKFSVMADENLTRKSCDLTRWHMKAKFSRGDILARMEREMGKSFGGEIAL